MNENEATVRIVRSVIIGFLVFVTLLFSNCQVTKYRVAEAINEGTHPYLAECALTDITCDRLLVIELEKL